MPIAATNDPTVRVVVAHSHAFDDPIRLEEPEVRLEEPVLELSVPPGRPTEEPAIGINTSAASTATRCSCRGCQYEHQK